MTAKRESSYLFRLMTAGAQQVQAAFNGIKSAGVGAMEKIETATVKTNKQLSGLSSLNKVFEGLRRSYASLVAVVALGGFATAAKQSLEFAANLRQAATNANTSTASLQELTFAANQYGIQNDVIISGLGELTKRAKEFADTGAGPAADAFRALGLSQERVADLSQDSSVLFEVLVNDIRQLDDTAARVRLVDMFFGGGGDDLVRLTSDSARAIGDLREEARSLGVVMSDDLAARAEDANKKIDALTLQLTTQFKVSLVEATVETYELATSLGAIAPEAEKAMEWLESVGDSMEGIAQKATKTAPSIFKWVSLLRGDFQGAVEWEKIETDINAGKVAGGGSPVELAQGSGTDDLMGIGSKGYSTKPSKPLQIGTNRGSDTATKSAASEQERAEKRIRETTEALEDEIRVVGLSEREQAILREERRLGTEATEAQKAKIRELAGTLYDEQEALRSMEESTRNLASTFEDTLGEALRGNLKSWEDWESKVLDIAASVAESLANQLGSSSGLGGISTILASSIIGAFDMGGSISAKPTVAGGRATGGPVEPGFTYRINEQADEFFVTSLSGRVVNPGQIGGKAQPVNVIINNNSSATIRTEDQSTGSETRLVAIIDDAMASNIGRAGSKTRKALGNYNSSQTIIRR